MHTKISAADRAYAHAKQAILGGRYPGGELVSEGDIAADVGVSRTPVREALLRLEVEGLVRLYPKRGALIVPVSQQEIDDVIETRRLIEGFTARVAAGADTRARAALVEALTARLAEMRARLEPGSQEFVHADRDFHRLVVAAGGNAILTGLYDSLRDRQLRMMRAGMRGTDRMLRNIEEHTAILTAIRDADPAAAERAVHAHMDHAAELLGAKR
ncbi:GntR family transcriptional regulator [Actinorugispora endophytica]|uniref:DNA-binding GntR family transcriptional regulator n=1 Tax=Actinorugispora endophytica TaxID=1605990 RepID=A0A4R6V4L3_9ACTN|nr:GntR family transcriptional regulator [Actinorugispora endophytica]TDQ55271.1 DNA-binding GntR family transcriptional regulator [Actinorugispora endophytica]